MNIKLTRQEIVRLLDDSAQKLDHHTVNHLHVARHHALQRHRASMSAWLGQDGTLRGGLHLSQPALNWAVAVIVAALLLCNLSYWYHTSDHDHSDIDIAILTDDLPVDMYVD